MNKIKLCILIILIIFLTLIGGVTYAANTMDLNITDARPYTKKTYTVTTPNGNIHTVFKIGQRNGANLNYEDAVYCLRSGLGFGDTEIANNLSELEDVTYTESYNLKTDANDVMNYYRNTIGYSNISNAQYNSILWIIDNMYLPEHQDSAEMKETLLKKAKIQNLELTDDDIEFIQQMALWYFSNYDENGGQNSLSLLDTYVLSNTTKINEESLSETKKEQVDKLYRYFIDNAKLNITNYGSGNTRGINYVKPEVQIDTTSKSVTKDDVFTVVGPFNISLTAGNVGYNLSFEIKDKNGKVVPKEIDGTPVVFIVDNPADMVPSANTIEGKIGQGDFYLKVPDIYGTEYDLTDLNIEAKITYEKIYNTTATMWIAEAKDQPVIKVEKEEVKEGNFKININKVDESGKTLLGAQFNLITDTRQPLILVDNGDGTFSTSEIEILNEGQEFIYDIEEIVAPKGYKKLNGTFRIKIITKLNSDGTKYIIEQLKFIDISGNEISIPEVAYEIKENEITLRVRNDKIKEFDLALRKNITKVNGVNKEPEIDTGKINTIDSTTGQRITTAEYAHKKDPIEVKTGDKVTYKISVYNEGDIPGIVTEVLDYLPEGLEFDPTDNPELIEHKADGYKDTEVTGKKYAYLYNKTTRELRILPIQRRYLFELAPFDGTTLDTDSLEIVCKVTATKANADQVLTNIATMKYESSNEQVADRDSSSIPSNLILPANKTDWENYLGDINNKPYLGDSKYFYKGQEDDDDFDKVVVKGVPFDLALRKFATKVNGKEITTKTPEINTSKLNTVDTVTGKTITTAIYTHSKEPVIVKQGDIVTFKLRVYNEGELNGYASKIAEHIPEGLGYLMDYKANTDNFWVGVPDETTKVIDLVGIDGLYKTEDAIKNLKIEDFNSKTSFKDVKILTGNAKIYTTALEDEIIKAYNPELVAENIDVADKWQQSKNGTDGLYYRDVEITCIVLAENTFKGTLRNIAEIQEDKAVDENDQKINVTDRDSTPDNVDITSYNPPTDNSSYQEDDDDYEPLQLRYFDLALRKFITKVNNEEIKTRIPKPTIDGNGDIKYEHDKTPINVTNSDLVTYTIRVYNEGTVLGYAMELSDDIPDGLVFLPNHETNKKYNWKMYDVNGKETTEPTEAVEIRTKYLENTLLNTYDAMKPISETNPYYADVEVIFQVIEEDITQEDRIIINKAQIFKDMAINEEGMEIDIKDEDSVPGTWNEGEDDQDIEKLYVKKFDLALLKWVTKTIVTVDGKTTTTDTGFTPFDDPEPIAKVVIDKKKINKTTVKFVYNIIVMNQGEIEGYAAEITDYIPKGLKFAAEDNPMWTKSGENKITTRALENTLLKPGESKTIEVIFTWENGEDNFGIKTNIAEISEDYNDKGSKDVDSTPDNVERENYDEKQEDDDDKALVLLEVKTGGVVTSYIWLVITVLLIIAGGIILIQKFVM